MIGAIAMTWRATSARLYLTRGQNLRLADQVVQAGRPRRGNVHAVKRLVGHRVTHRRQIELPRVAAHGAHAKREAPLRALAAQVEIESKF